MKKKGRVNLPKKPTRGLGELVYTGEKQGTAVVVTAVSYDKESFKRHTVVDGDLEKIQNEFFGTTWINIDGVHDVNLVERIGKRYGLNVMVMEDILNTTRRPRTESYEDYLFTVCNRLSFSETDTALQKEQISFILKKDLLITFQEDTHDDFDEVRGRIRSSKGPLRSAGADFLLYTLLDEVVDKQFRLLEILDERMEAVEELLVAYPNSGRLRTIHEMKNQIILFRKYVWPMREVIGRLERDDSEQIQDSTRVYFRDLYDHVVELMDMLETFREMIYGLIDIYMSSVSNRMNEIMKVLTVISTIFIPLTFIVGLYGMNFKYMPELEQQWGYPAVLTLMVGIAVSMILFVKRKRWV